MTNKIDEYDVKTVGDVIIYIIQFFDENMGELEILEEGNGLGQVFENLKRLPFNGFMLSYLDEPTDENIFSWSLDLDTDDYCGEIEQSSTQFSKILDLRNDLIKFLGDRTWN